jgi:hypothetical protein
MISWLELFKRTEECDDYRNLYLGAGFADFPEFDRSNESDPITPDQQPIYPQFEFARALERPERFPWPLSTVLLILKRFYGKCLRGRLVPAGTGTSGPEDRSRRLPLSSRRAARWTVTTQRAGTHPQAWADGRRNIVKRSATIAAKFSVRVGCPQPVAASRTLRIDALHSPSRQILHAFSPPGRQRDFFRSR